MKVICTKDLKMDDGKLVYKCGNVYDLNSGSLKSGVCTITDEFGDKGHTITGCRDGWVQYFVPEDFKITNL